MRNYDAATLLFFGFFGVNIHLAPVSSFYVVDCLRIVSWRRRRWWFFTIWVCIKIQAAVLNQFSFDSFHIFRQNSGIWLHFGYCGDTMWLWKCLAGGDACCTAALLYRKASARMGCWFAVCAAECVNLHHSSRSWRWRKPTGMVCCHLELLFCLQELYLSILRNKLLMALAEKTVTLMLGLFPDTRS